MDAFKFSVSLIAVGFGGWVFWNLSRPMEYRHYQASSIKAQLVSAHKNCAVLIYNGETNFNHNLIGWPFSTDSKHHPDWRIVDFETRGPLNPDQQCSEAHLLAVTTKNQKYWQKLAYGFNLQNAQKSCVTRDGDSRDDWSCE